MEKVKLKDIAEVYSGLTFLRYKDDNGTLKKMIVQRSIKNGEKVSDFEEIRFNDKMNERYLTQKGDVLMKTMYPFDTTYVDEEGLVIGDRIAIIRLKEGYDPSFITHLFNNFHIKKQLHRVKSVGSISQVSVREIKELELVIPNYEEQKQFAELFDYIDEKININYQIIETDKKMKEGILNKLIEGCDINE